MGLCYAFKESSSRAMPAVTTAYVKNIIKRGLSELVDPSPTKDDHASIWQHFNSSCAYCGTVLIRAEEKGRIDHLLAASKGGANSIGNRVLSCGSCNDKEKLDQPWEPFLRSKSESAAVFDARRQRIAAWQTLHPIGDEARHQSLREAASEKAFEVIKVFEEKVRELQQLVREARRSSPPHL
jgi:hypothetical protein